jgi:plasmid rolling circle replication initiator protein Rep
MIKAHNRAFRRITLKYRIRAQRGKGEKLMGIKTVECNFNPKNRTYNPHLHLIVPGKQMAETIIDEWLKLWTKEFTHRDAQNLRKVADKEKDLIEVTNMKQRFLLRLTERKAGANKELQKYIFVL